MRDNFIKVSVIVPVYNVEYYIEECLDSIVNQELEEIEIICIDDGSTDRTPEILKWYEKTYEKVSVIWQKNCYAGVARNNGLKYAKGEYVIFWDSDDIFKADALLKMYNQARGTDSDLCICNAKNYDNANCKAFKKYEYTRVSYAPKEVFSYKDVRNNLYDITTTAIWKILIKREFLIDNDNLRFEDTRRANDLRFFGMIMPTAKRITILNEYLIQYRVGMNNNLQSNHSHNPLSEYYSLKQIKEYLIQEDYYDDIKVSFDRLVIRTLCYALERKSESEYFEELRELILNDENPIIVLEDVKLLNDGSFLQCKKLIGYLTEPVEYFFPTITKDSSIVEMLGNDERTEKIFSVIVTVYNDEKYILEALESIIAQDYDNYEIIIVNDGSIDTSDQICRAFLNRNKRTQIVYILQKNKGVSEARNIGLEYAKGKYIRFLDGDDKFNECCLKITGDMMESNNLDLLISGIHAFKDEDTCGLDETLNNYCKYYHRKYNYVLKVTGKEMFTKTWLRNEFLMSIGTQAFKKSLLINNDIKFEKGIYHEDDLFSFNAMISAESVMLIKDELYERRVRHNSIMTTNDKAKIVKKGKDRLKIGWLLFEEYIKVANTCDDSRFDIAVIYYIEKQISKGLSLLKGNIKRSVIRDNIRLYRDKNVVYYSMVMNAFDTNYRIAKLEHKNSKIRKSLTWKIAKVLRKVMIPSRNYK